MSLSDLPLRAQTLGGQIKQADADFGECELMETRAVKALDLARANTEKAAALAASLRDKRDAMRDEAHELVGKIGEPTPVAGGEVSSSADAGGDALPAFSLPQDFFVSDMPDGATA